MENFDEFYKRLYRQLFLYAVRMTGNSETAADIAQESFARCIRRYGEQNRDGALLFATARNLLRDGFRRRRLREVFLREARAEKQAGSDVLEIREEYRNVMKGLERLDDESRELLSMVASSDLSYREIAEMNATTEANVKVRVHRARVRLKAILQEFDRPVPEG